MDGYPDKRKMCHRTGFARSCRELLDDGVCQGRWVNVIARDPQTAAEINRWGCVDDQAVLIQMSIEARLVGVQAAVESRGNETLKMLAENINRSGQQHNESMAMTGRLAQATLAIAHAATPEGQKLLAAE